MFCSFCLAPFKIPFSAIFYGSLTLAYGLPVNEVHFTNPTLLKLLWGEQRHLPNQLNLSQDNDNLMFLNTSIYCDLWPEHILAKFNVNINYWFRHNFLSKNLSDKRSLGTKYEAFCRATIQNAFFFAKIYNVSKYSHDYTDIKNHSRKLITQFWKSCCTDFIRRVGFLSSAHYLGTTIKYVMLSSLPFKIHTCATRSQILFVAWCLQKNLKPQRSDLFACKRNFSRPYYHQ